MPFLLSTPWQEPMADLASFPKCRTSRWGTRLFLEAYIPRYCGMPEPRTATFIPAGSLAPLGLSLTYPIAAFLLLDLDCKHFGTVTISWTIQQAPRRLPVSVYRVEMPMLAPSGREMVSDCITLPRGMYNFKLKECVFVCVQESVCCVCMCVHICVHICDTRH